ncbi:TPA: hypothetical protein ACOQ6H_000423 [Bacillus cereus]
MGRCSYCRDLSVSRYIEKIADILDGIADIIGKSLIYWMESPI